MTLHLRTGRRTCTGLGAFQVGLNWAAFPLVWVFFTFSFSKFCSSHRHHGYGNTFGHRVYASTSRLYTSMRVPSGETLWLWVITHFLATIPPPPHTHTLFPLGFPKISNSAFAEEEINFISCLLFFSSFLVFVSYSGEILSLVGELHLSRFLVSSGEYNNGTGAQRSGVQEAVNDEE